MSPRPTIPTFYAASVAALIAAGGLLVGCGSPDPEALTDSVARIDGDFVRTVEFEDYLRRTVNESLGDLSSEVLSELFDNFLDERLLVRLAVSRGVSSGGDTPRSAIDRLLGAARLPGPDRARLAAYYEAHREEFARPERVRVRQILVEERGEAEKALAELSGGADFEAVVRKYSRDPSADFGGDQGELAREELPPAFSRLIFRLAPAEVSEIVSADYGFHIFQVVERLPAMVVPLEEVEAEIRGRILAEEWDRLLGSLVREARSRYNVKVYAGILPFNYQGSYRDDKV